MSPIRRPLALCVALCMLPASARGGVTERFAIQRLAGECATPPLLTTDPASGAVLAWRDARVALQDGRARAAEAARDWLAAHGEAFGLDPERDRLSVERDETLADGRHRVLLRRSWNGIPVHGGDARAIVDADGALRFVAAGFRGAISAPSVATVDAARALATAATALGVSLERSSGAAELRVWRRDDGDRLAWSVGVTLADGREARSWVDATTGELLELDAGIANAVGLVYPTDPRAPLAEVPLYRLEPGPGLVSHALGIQDVVNPPVAPLGPDGDYRYPETDPFFNQVNVYWQADRFVHDFLGGLGYAGPPESLVVRVNVGLQPFVALTTGRYVYFGQPIDGFVHDASRADDVIHHELTHAVIYGYGVQPTGPHREAGALHEGLADYFAAASTGDPAIGDWLYLPWPRGATRVDQPVDPWNYAHYDQVAFNGGDLGSTWGNGMILSSALWDLRAAIGASADSLVLESLVYLPTEPVWSQFANALLQADADRHAGRLGDRVVQAMLRRGIRGAVVASMSGPTTLEPGVTGVFEAQPCCGSLLGGYHWLARGWCRGAPCGDWQDLAQGPTLRTAFDQDSELQLVVDTPWGDTLRASRFVSVRPPGLVVQGPLRVAQGGRGTWQARVVAMGPYRVTWLRQWRRAGASPEVVGDGLETSLAADTSFDLTALLTDGLNRSVTQRLTVQTFKDAPPPASVAFRLRHTLGAAASSAQTTFELPDASSARLTVVDVSGRTRLVLWDGPAGRGPHAIRWDPGPFAPGVYFVRLVAAPGELGQRFTVLR